MERARLLGADGVPRGRHTSPGEAEAVITGSDQVAATLRRRSRAV